MTNFLLNVAARIPGPVTFGMLPPAQEMTVIGFNEGILGGI